MEKKQQICRKHLIFSVDKPLSRPGEGSPLNGPSGRVCHFRALQKFVQRSLTQKVVVSCRRNTTFQNRIAAVTDPSTFLFSKLVFRLRETTTFERQVPFPKILARRKMAHANLDAGQLEAFSAP